MRDILGRKQDESILHTDHLLKSYYNLEGWVLMGKPKYDPATNTYTFKFINRSSGYYIARPWKVKDQNDYEYKIIPRSHIQVGSIPAMILQSRSVVPQQLKSPDLQEVRVMPLGAARKRKNNDSIIQHYKEYYDNIKTINIKGRRVPHANLNYEDMKKRFMDYVTQQCIDWISIKENKEFKIQ